MFFFPRCDNVWDDPPNPYPSPELRGLMVVFGLGWTGHWELAAQRREYSSIPHCHVTCTSVAYITADLMTFLIAF